MIGISCPGPLDLKTGTILDPANLIKKWHSFKIIEYVSEKTKIKSFLNNDANIQALAHALYGKGKGYKVVQFFTFSTGLGTGLIIDGKIFTGELGFAMEIANIPLGIKD
jgi:glucokinase